MPAPFVLKECDEHHITIDGRKLEVRGVVCVVANSGSLGLPGLTLAPTIDMNDCLLDVLVIGNTDIESLVATAASSVRQDESAAPFQHRTAREVSVVPEPYQAIQADCEVLARGPVHARILPHAAHIIVPRLAVRT